MRRASGLRALRADALVLCTHELGRVSLAPSQSWVRVGGVPLLVARDPERRRIAGCPNATVVTKPCTTTLAARTGYSDLVRVDGRALCLDSLTGTTDGQGGVYRYEVEDAGQDLVVETTGRPPPEGAHG